ncbi:MAG: hypothetical protein WA110_00530 [Anaerolineaceae bacterium]
MGLLQPKTPDHIDYSNKIEYVPLLTPVPDGYIVDLAPDISDEDKSTVIVIHADGTKTLYLVSEDKIDNFVQNLAQGDSVLQILPPSSLMGQFPDSGLN